MEGNPLRLGTRPGQLDAAADLAAALRAAAAQLGHRPAVTVLTPDRREEQGFTSLAQWASKGAHLLEYEFGFDVGARVALAPAPGWPLVAVCLACWWSGVTVVFDGPGDLVVAHLDHPVPDGSDVLWIGDAVDGTPVSDTTGEPWSVAVQAFPDQPPPARAGSDVLALQVGDRTWSHAELIAAAGRWDQPGPLGVTANLDPLDLVVAMAVRPLATGNPSVLVRGVDTSAASGEGVTDWA
ncbi:MAG: hypothetical protein KY469_08245 [Actinobacteria bacterium]|nr:hypothetical protein [Actinomycetota bacterium]